MASEEQLANNASIFMYGPTQNVRMGQRMTIAGRTISALSFLLLKSGSPTGDITFTIRRESDKAILASKVWGDASGLTTGATWREVTFDTPLEITNTEVDLLCEFAGGNSSNSVGFRDQGTDVKANENERRYSGGAWENPTTRDAAYKYTYILTPALGVVTTQAMTAMDNNSATAHGNISSLGQPTASQHGHCWNETGNPDITDDKTENGVPAGTGAYTSSLTNQKRGTVYYIRSYVTNNTGTAYGEQVQFTTRTGNTRLYENLLTPTNDLGSVYGTAWNAQLFTPTTEHSVLKIRFKMYRAGSPGTITVGVRAVSGGQPSGDDLCYGTYDGDTLTTDGDGEWITITLDQATTQDLLAVSTQYALVLRAPSGDVTNAAFFRAENTGVFYTGGYRCASDDSGATWTQYPTLDILFGEEGIIFGGRNKAIIIH